jgi:hypothetical protein
VSEFVAEYSHEHVQEFLHKRLSLCGYKIQILHEIKDTEMYTRTETSNLMLNINLFYGARFSQLRKLSL